MICGIDRKIANSIKLISEYDDNANFWYKAYLFDVNILDDDALYKKAFNSLPDFRKRAANKFKFAKDKKLSTGAWVVLTFAMQNCGIDNIQDLFKTNENGKPYVSNSNNRCFFNLSHSGNYALCVVSGKEVGCDIQRQDDITDKLIDFCMNDAELTSFADSEYKQWGKEPFYRLWTLKESLMKMTSYGLSINPLWIQFVKIDMLAGYYEYEVSGNKEIKIPKHAQFFEQEAPANYKISMCIGD